MCPADPAPRGRATPLWTRLPSADHVVLARGLMSHVWTEPMQNPNWHAPELVLGTGTGPGFLHTALHPSA